MLRPFYSPTRITRNSVSNAVEWMHQFPEDLPECLPSPQELHQPGLAKVSAGRYNGGFCLLSGMSPPDRQAPSTPISGGLCHLQPRLMKRKIPSHVLYHVTHPPHSHKPVVLLALLINYSFRCRTFVISSVISAACNMVTVPLVSLCSTCQREKFRP